MAEKNSLWKNIRNKAKQNRESGATPKKPTREMLNQERKIKAKKAEGGPVGDDELYNIKRAVELGYTPDETGHWPSVDSETGMFLKSKEHPTAWMEYLYGHTLNPELNRTTNVVVNPEGYFGDNQLQYIPKEQKAEGGYMYIDGGKTGPGKGLSYIPPTRQDSIDVLNNTIAINDYYLRNNYKKSAPPSMTEKERVELQKYFSKKEIDKLEKSANPKNYLNRLQGSRDSYKTMLERKDSGRHITKEGASIEKRAPFNEYYQKVDDNKFKQRENSSGMLDLRSPMPLYDERITPQRLNIFDSPDSIKSDEIRPLFLKAKDPNEIKRLQKELDSLTNADRVEVFQYDPIAVTPFDMLNEEQKKERAEKYGSSGVPESYTNSKNTNSAVTPAPTIETTPTPAKRKAAINRGANSSKDADGNPLVSEVNFGDGTGWHSVPYNTLDQYEEIKAEGGYYPTQGPPKALFKGYAQGGYTNPYNQYQDDPYLQYAYGGYEYGNGGRTLKNIGAGAFGVLEGLVDTTFGWIPGVDYATDQAYKGLQKLGGSSEDEIREQDSIHGYGQTAGAVGSAILTSGATTGSAISEGAEGLGQGISRGSADSEVAQGIGKGLNIAGTIVGTAYNVSDAGKASTEAFKLSNAGSTGIGKFAAAAPKSATALTAARTARAANSLDSAGNVIGNAAPEGTKIVTDAAGNASSIKPSIGVFAAPTPAAPNVSSLAPNLPAAATASAAIPTSLPTSVPSTSDYSRLEKVGDIVSGLSSLPKSQEPPEMAPPVPVPPAPKPQPQIDYDQFAVNAPTINTGFETPNYDFGYETPSNNYYAAQGGNITNNSLNLRNTMRYKRFAKGGSFDQYGINMIPESAGLHHESAYGGVPIGPDALAEGGEIKMNTGDGGQYIVSDQVDGSETQKDFMFSKGGKYKELNRTLADGMKQDLNRYTFGSLATSDRVKGDLRRPNDSYSQSTIEQIKNKWQQKTEYARQRSQQEQAIAQAEEQKRMAEEQYIAAYGGKINPKKYPGLNYAKGGIHIKPENKGKFTASAEAAGHTVQEHARAVLNNPNATPLQKKRANFARNAAKWNHADGGYVYNPMTQPMLAEGGPIYGDPASDYVYARGGMYGNPYARGGQIDYTNDMYSMYAGGGPLVGNVPQPFNGPAAQNRGGMLMTYPDGGMMPPEQQMMQQQQMQQQQGQMPQQGGQDQMMQMVQQVMEALMQGANPEQVMQQLVQSGVPPEQAQQIIQVAMQEAQGQQQPMQEGQQPMQGQEEMMPQEMAHGGYIQYARGGKTGGVPVELTPTQEHFANEMYKRYGKVVMTDKATNETIYGTKKQDGTWDLNKFEVLTGANSTGQDMAIPVEEIEKLKGSEKHAQKKTPLGVWGLKKQDNIYGMPGYFLGNTSAAYHTTYKGKDDPNRSALYGNKNNEDNYRSYGCINCEKPSMQALLNFVGDTGFATVIDSRISPEENAKWMKQNTPSTHFRYEKPKAAAKPANKKQSANNPMFDVLPQQVKDNLSRGPVQTSRPKTEKIKEAVVRKNMANTPAPSNRNMGMAAVTNRPMPAVRQAVRQPQQQQPSAEYQGVSIVDYLASKGQDFSKEARAKLAAEHGIKNYNYTAEDNTNLLNALRNKTQHAAGGKMYYRGGPDMPPYNPINPMVNSSSYIQDQYGLEDLYGGVDDGSHSMFTTDEYGNVVRNSYRPTYNMNNLNRLKSNYFDNSNSFNPNPYLPNNQLGSYTSTNAMEPGIYDDMQRLKINPGDYPSIITNTTRPNLDRLPELPNNQLSPMPPSGPVDMSIYNENFVKGVDADGRPVSWNPAILDDYDKTTGAKIQVNPNTLGEDFTDTRQQVSPAGQQNQSGYKGFTGMDAAMAATQLAGAAHQFFQKKPEPFKYQKPQYKELDPTAAIIASNQAQREAQALANYEIRQNAPTSGSYLSNIRATALQSAKQRGAAASAIRGEYDKVNFNAYNRNQEVGSEIGNKNIDAIQQDEANWQEQRTNALYNAGANLAGMYRDKKMQDVYKNYVAPNIGTANMGYVQDANGNWILTPKSGSNSNFQVTPPAKVGTVESPTGLTEISPDVTSDPTYALSMPNELQSGDETKAFQDYLDATNPNWYKGKKLGQGKYYGTFGPSTREAYAKYKDAYGNKQKEAARLMYNITNPYNPI